MATRRSGPSTEAHGWAAARGRGGRRDTPKKKTFPKMRNLTAEGTSPVGGRSPASEGGRRRRGAGVVVGAATAKREVERPVAARFGFLR
jgi:hypothetical protein